MEPLPAQDMRTNLGTWAIRTCLLPALTDRLVQVMSPESYDPDFEGQALTTSYFDTCDFKLRKARARKQRYLTLRLRQYRSNQTCALSVKTESEKYRKQLTRDEAYFLHDGPRSVFDFAPHLSADLFARLIELTENADLEAVATVFAYRYAVESKVSRFTLDTEICTSTGKKFHASVLEYKVITPGDQANLITLASVLPKGATPIKLSKFLWATSTGE
jgi:hypothetical protein